jgi:uncharacterized protein YcfJ
MNNTLLAIVTTIGFSISINAFADHDRHSHHRDKYSDYAKVVHVEPIYKTVHISEPKQRCWKTEDRKPVIHRVNHAKPEQLIMGGIIGGVIGHELGKNNNQELATITGAIIGTAVAQSANTSYYYNGEYRNGEYRSKPQQHCRTESRYRTEEQLKGYRVTYRYKGDLHTTFMRQHPGKRIRLNTEITPGKSHHRH